MTDPNHPTPDSIPNRPLLQRLLGFPATRPGWWSIILFLATVVLMVLSTILIKTGPEGGRTFFANPILALTIILAGASAVAGGVAGVFAVARRGERALLVLFTILWSLLALAFAMVELGGH